MPSSSHTSCCASRFPSRYWRVGRRRRTSAKPASETRIHGEFPLRFVACVMLQPPESDPLEPPLAPFDALPFGVEVGVLPAVPPSTAGAGPGLTESSST